MSIWVEFSLHFLACLCTLFLLTSSSTRHSLAQSIVSNLSLASPNVTELGFSNVNTAGFAFLPPDCTDAHAEELTVAICVEAYIVFGTWLRAQSREKIVIGPRGEGLWDLPSPMRFTARR